MVTKDSGGSWANIGAPPAGAASVVDAALTAGHLNIGPATILHDHPIKRADPYYTDLVYTWGERGPASCSFRIGGETLNAYRDPPEGCVRDYWVEVYDEDVLVWDGQIASAKGIAG